MQKYVRFIVLIFVYILLFNTGVSAVSSTYNISELGLDITIPSSYKVITRDTPANATVFSDLGIIKADIMEQFEASKIYLNAVSDTANEEVVVTMEAIMIDNFSALSDTSLKALASSLINEYEKIGISILKYDIYQHSQAKFIRIYWEDATNSVNGLQYYTAYNEKAMNFTMRSYSGEITTDQEQSIKSIVDSVRYDTPPIEASAETQTDTFIYTDVDTNTRFTVPANWYEKEFFEEREFIDVKFVSSEEAGLTIIYGSTDLWGMLTPEEQKGLSRSELDSSDFEIADIATFYGIDENLITTVTYNGIDYFQATVKQTADVYDTKITVDMTFAIHIENGWGYLFQFGGTTSNDYFEDFQELLNSVEYPYYQNEISTARLKIALTFSIILIVAGSLFYIFIERRIHKSEEKVITTVSINSICPYCNAPLLDNGCFCHKCGKKLSTITDNKNDL